ncbi:unnamed protein product [Ambrosiozyma monospora]|uniref:Unnamed protein product n=1 Tax=Ambrosiozyma monospora TaxID=43982 RepID=A0ACB5T0G9_AMBMO|nr:unnamed protein product [Ambrosiozyma monospora]
MINFCSILITFLHFRGAVIAQGVDRDAFTFKGWFQPYLAYYGLFIIICMIGVQGYTVFLPGNWSVTDFLFAYLMIFIDLALFIVWKVLKRTKYLKPMDRDITSGLEEVDTHEKYLAYLEDLNGPTKISAIRVLQLANGKQVFENMTSNKRKEDQMSSKETNPENNNSISRSSSTTTTISPEKSNSTPTESSKTAQQPKKKRQKYSRNGCSACKKRKIKCDEKLPICGRCERLKIECTYYRVFKFQAGISESAKLQDNGQQINNLVQQQQQQQQQQLSGQLLGTNSVTGDTPNPSATEFSPADINQGLTQLLMNQELLLGDIAGINDFSSPYTTSQLDDIQLPADLQNADFFQSLEGGLATTNGATLTSNTSSPLNKTSSPYSQATNTNNGAIPSAKPQSLSSPLLNNNLSTQSLAERNVVLDVYQECSLHHLSIDHIVFEITIHNFFFGTGSF